MEAGSHQKPYRSLDRLRRTRGIANPPAFSSHIKRRVPLKLFQKHSLQHHLVTALPSSFLPPSFVQLPVCCILCDDWLSWGRGRLCPGSHFQPFVRHKSIFVERAQPRAHQRFEGSFREGIFFHRYFMFNSGCVWSQLYRNERGFASVKKL